MQGRKQVEQAHPANLLVFLPRLVVLLSLPLLRGMISVGLGGFTAWLAGAWMDLAFVGAILLTAVLRWKAIRYSYDDTGIYYSRGILRRQTIFIPLDRLSTVTMRIPFWVRPLRVVELRADTPAGRIQQADFTLYVPKGEAENILHQRHSIHRRGVECTHAPSRLSVALLSLVTSNSLAGLLLLTTFISNLGDFVGRGISQRFFGTLNHIGQALAFGIPPAAAALAYLLLFGWLIAFCVELLRNQRFLVSRQGGLLTLSNGIVTHRSDTVEVQRINFTDQRETVFSRILGMGALYIHAPGLGRVGEESAMIPVVRRDAVQKYAAALLPEFTAVPRQIKPNAGAVMRFLGDPALCFAGLLAGVLLLRWYMPAWWEFTVFLGILCAVPAAWFLVVRILDFCTSGIARQGEMFTLRYSHGFYLHTVVVPKDKIVQVMTRQSIFQRMDGKCDVMIYTYSQGHLRHRLRNLPEQEVNQLFEIHAKKRNKK